MPQTNHPTPQTLLDVALTAATKGSEIIREQRTSMTVSVSFKDRRNLVTTADIASENAIIETIRSSFPTHLILAEETAQSVSPEEYGRGPAWIIDPIDGTTNYAYGHFQVGISIACAIDGIVQAGVVAAPFLGEIFTATKGGGAFCNHKPISISNANTIEDAVVATGFPYDRTNIHGICARIEAIATRCRDIRRLGAASLDLCWVACGRLDAYFEERIQPWDGAAGVLIAREAGAAIRQYEYTCESQKLTQRYPGDLCVDNIIATTPALMQELKALLDGSDNT